ncbi:MAG: hypothetical protein JWL66_1711 [Sphingomonadales bacterium]|nr:hypothetical protein [Sphingomonadales bacterium]
MITVVIARMRDRIIRIIDDCRGITVVEFGLIAVPMCLMILPPIDLAYNAYVQSIIQGSLVKAARLSTTGQYTNTQIDQVVRDQLGEFDRNATITITRTSYPNFSAVSSPERIITDTAPIGTYNIGDCYIDQNNNGQWDSDMGKAGEAGSPDDAVLFKVTMTYAHIIPMTALLGFSANQTITSSTIVQNQPYAATAVWVAPTRCT